MKKGFANLRGFVNGVLRNVARNLEQVEYPKEERKALALKYSMPEWIFRNVGAGYALFCHEKIIASFQQEIPVTIRCNQEKASPEQLKAALEAEGITVEEHPYLPSAFRISGYDYLKNLSCFRKGWFVVQDISSMLAVEAAQIKENDRVLDVCAAPGGKALYMAEKLKGTGMVEARDLTMYKTGLIEENIARTGFQNIKAVCKDAAVLDEETIGSADIVLADLPCSGLGVLEKADLKYKVSPAGMKELVLLQRRILHTVQNYVKPGGTLLYSTCTIHKEENEENVHWFLKEHPAFVLEDIRKTCAGNCKAA